MKITKLLPVMAIAMLFCCVSCSTENADSNDAIDAFSAPQTKTIEVEIMDLINSHRLNQGLNALDDHNTVKAVAYTHTEYMIEVSAISHDNFFQRKQSLQDNADANAVGENVAYGFNSAEAVVEAWLNSEAHRENIEGNFTDFDISAEQDEFGNWYYTNMFIKR